jgi:translation initiation factor IF-2
VDDLLETILLQAEVEELMSNPDKPAKGTVIEVTTYHVMIVLITPVHVVLCPRSPAWHACKGAVVCFSVENGTAGAPRPAARPRRHAAGAGRHPAHW